MGKTRASAKIFSSFLLTSLDYPSYAHVAEPLASFLAHPQSITINAFASQKDGQLAAAYANAKEHYYLQMRSESARGPALRIADRMHWHISSGTVIRHGLALLRTMLMRIFR